MMPEALLREIWKDHSNFLRAPLRLADGTLLTILECGRENTHRDGPDLLDARLAFADGAVAVRGDVEIHLTPRHWSAHHHDGDPKYSNVILHVVLESEDEVHLEHGPPVPTVVLRDNLLYDRRALWEALFAKLYDRAPELACFPHNLMIPMRMKRKVIQQFGEARLDALIDRLLIAEQEVVREADLLERVYQLTMDAVGYAQNRVPFRELSSVVPLARLRDVRQLFGERTLVFEALYFGLAGLLPDPSNEFDREANEYLLELTALWRALEQTFPLPERLGPSDWAFFRIRPANSPYRRLALAAALAAHYFSRDDWSFSSSFFHDGPELPARETSREGAVTSDFFWQERTSFRSPRGPIQELLGEERASAIRTNVVLPARLAWLRISGMQAASAEALLRRTWGEARTRASAKYLSFVEQELLESESVNSVRSEQGALLLKRNFCDERRCSECPIGAKLLERSEWRGPNGH